eukprot:482351_1
MTQSCPVKLSMLVYLFGKVMPAEMETTTFSEDLHTVPMSDLWEEEKRRKSTSDKHSFPDHVLNNLRSRRRTIDAWYNNYQDGKSQKATTNLSKPQHYPFSIPSILVCLGDKNTIGGGWDVILPKGWARPFWGALVFTGRNYWNDKRQYRVDDGVKEGRKSGRRCTTTTLGSKNDTLFIREGQKFWFAKIELYCGVVNSGAQVYIAEEEHRIARATALATTVVVRLGRE